MFSGISNILSNAEQRRAEESDTRQALQRHDPEYQRNQKKKQPPKEPEFDEDGSAVVSVEALAMFLKNFLQTKSDASAAPDRRKSDRSDKPQQETTQNQLDLNDQEQKAVSAKAAIAANAYASTKIKTERKEQVLLETTDTAATGPELDLHAADIRAIHTMLEQLKILSENNIESLKITRAESFLQSLQNAVTIAISNIRQ